MNISLLLITYFSVDDNFEKKNLCPSQNSNHRSPVFRTGSLTNSSTETRIPTKEQTSLSFKFQSKTLMNATCYYSLESNPQVGI